MHEKYIRTNLLRVNGHNRLLLMVQPDHVSKSIAANFGTSIWCALQAEVAAAKGKAAAEVDALARALDMRGRELAKLKQLSAAVLQQRGDLETFLLSSIDMVQALALPSTRPGVVFPHAFHLCGCLSLVQIS